MTVPPETFIFELMVYSCFLPIAYHGYRKNGVRAILYFSVILFIAIFAENTGLASERYSYPGFIVRIDRYPLAVGIGWTIISYIAYCFTNTIFGDTFLKNKLPRVKQWNNWELELSYRPLFALIDGLTVYMLSFPIELSGAQIGLWVYDNAELLRVPSILNVPLMTLWTYGTAAMVFNLLLRILNQIHKVSEGQPHHKEIIFESPIDLIPISIFTILVFGYFGIVTALNGDIAYLSLIIASGGFLWALYLLRIAGRDDSPHV